MADRFDELLTKARGGADGDVDALADALLAALAAGGDDAARALEVLRALVRHRSAKLRCAAASVLAERCEPSAEDLLATLAADRDDAVRAELVGVARTKERPLPDAVLRRLLDDVEFEVAGPAIEMAAGREALVPDVVRRLRENGYWPLREAAAKALRPFARDHLDALVETMASCDDEDVVRACAASAEFALAPERGPPPACGARPAALRKALEAVREHAAGAAPRLESWLGPRAETAVDAEELKTYGVDLTAEAEAGRLARAHRVESACALIEDMISADGSRAVVLLGPSGAGKTAIVEELVHRLRADPAGPWRVIRASPADLLAGTLYLGEWETKIRDLVRAVERPRRVLLHVPDVDQLADAGRSSRTDLNMAAMLLPHLEKGQVALIGESTPEAFQRAVAKVPGLRRTLRPVEVRPPDAEGTLDILRAVRDERGAEMDDRALARLVELTDFYLAGVAQPGRSVGLLRRVLDRTASRPGPVTVRDVLETLSAATGIPAHLLDDRTPLDLDEVREFFASRVMGQPEAVDAVVDLVALVKAGLCDPGKPFGVLLSVGPTGVGKTELARALAEFLFGDPARMVRLDMSEFASYEGFERLLGKGGDGLLTRPVHDQPFSVVLLDEIEKAHENVFDVCLQIFDAGRLTDGAGRTVDFRRTIVVLTSNVGAAVATEAPAGFGATEPGAPDADATLRELRRFFRPEFLNRIDRIVHFRPLAIETADRIARREVARVLDRSGIARRGLVVDVGDDVVALLLRQGYSRALGARPLKRTVERTVLLPVARVLAAGSVPEGAVVRLSVRSGAVHVAVVRESAAPSGESPPPSPEPSAVARAAAEVAARVDALRPRAEELAASKAAQLARTGDSAFWKVKATAQAALDRVHRLETILGAWNRLERRAADLGRRAARLPGGRAKGDGIARAVADLAREADRVGALLAATDDASIGDALVVLTRASANGAPLRGVERLAAMYRAFAAARGLETEVMDDRRSDDPPEDVLTLLVAGGGAFGLLRGETGMHLVSRRRARRTGDGRTEDREAVRVEVLAVPAADAPLPASGVRVEARRLRDTNSRFGGALAHDAHLIDERTLAAASARSADSRKDAVARAWTLLRARLARPPSPPEDAIDAVRRRYETGSSPVVRDARSGRSSGNADRVLAGELDLVL